MRAGGRAVAGSNPVSPTNGWRVHPDAIGCTFGTGMRDRSASECNGVHGALGLARTFREQIGSRLLPKPAGGLHGALTVRHAALLGRLREVVPELESRLRIKRRACPVGAGEDRRGCDEMHAVETAGGRRRTVFDGVADWVAEVARQAPEVNRFPTGRIPGGRRQDTKRSSSAGRDARRKRP